METFKILVHHSLHYTQSCTRAEYDNGLKNYLISSNCYNISLHRVSPRKLCHVDKIYNGQNYSNPSQVSKICGDILYTAQRLWASQNVSFI